MTVFGKEESLQSKRGEGNFLYILEFAFDIRVGNKDRSDSHPIYFIPLIEKKSESF